MSINQEWSNRNAGRAYPFTDQASLLDDSQRRLPNNLLTGGRITYPRALGRYAYIGALSVSPQLVTAIILAADAPTAEGQLIASISQKLPLRLHQPYAIQSLSPQVAGWLTFGEGTQQPGTYRASSYQQTGLCTSFAVPYDTPGVSSVAKQNHPGMGGLVKLIGGNDMQIVATCAHVPGHTAQPYDDNACVSGDTAWNTNRRWIVQFNLLDKTQSRNRNVLEKYAGPCSGRPENRNCPNGNPIESISGVYADCCGDIFVTLRGCASLVELRDAITVDADGDPVLLEDAAGVMLHCAVSGDEVCGNSRILPNAQGQLPRSYGNFCEEIVEL